MFGNLFDEERLTGGMAASGSNTHFLNVPISRPPTPRNSCGFSGIANQGATCYLNSLLQTLLLTPEFREGLFRLSDQELGSIEERDKGGKVRIIPLQLQRLFSRLLLVDQQAATTSDLTDSFGWTNKEGMQQHDVQELNRILFCAIESSLVGTSGNNLISKLYHGSTVTEIVCQMCGKISEKEEDFLDLNVIVASFKSLQDSLNATFLQLEMMKGKNQYRCSTCCNLVDAEKGIKIRCLPPILTFSLSRFSYDIAKGERYKETGRFVFPMEIDMSPYCHKKLSEDDSVYELFSVVIHSGSSYGGHYHAFIRDVDCLGRWFIPSDEPTTIPSGCDNGFEKVEGALELLKALLSRQENGSLPMDGLCREISKCTGFSWNKKYKKSHGTISKFLQKHSDVFHLNPVNSTVHLKDNSQNSENLNEDDPNMDTGVPLTESPKDTKRPSVKCALKLNFFDKKKVHVLSSEFAQNWFDFNDIHVSPIYVKDIEKQFSGKESAYMLFYRRKSLLRPQEAKGNLCYMMPKSLIDLAEAENGELFNQRELYEEALNTINIFVCSSDNYTYEQGALQCKDEKLMPTTIAIDKRKPVSKLRELIQNTHSSETSFNLYIANLLPSGLHLSKELVPAEDHISLAEVGILEGAKVFFCDDTMVDGHVLVVGAEFEPILLHVSTNFPTGNLAELSRGFPKLTTVANLKILLSELLNLQLDDIVVNKMAIQGGNTQILPIAEEQINQSLLELGFNDGDSIVLESLSQKLQNATYEQGNKTLLIMVEANYALCNNGESKKCQLTEVVVEPEMTIGEVKSLALSKLSVDTSKQYVLRKYMENVGKGPPIHEHECSKSGVLDDVKCVVLEEGKPLAPEEIFLRFSVIGHSVTPVVEMNLDKRTTIQQCLKIVLRSSGLKGDSWHLQKSNWCGEPMEMLYLETATLEDENINNGDFLYIASGRVPPKGFLTFTIWLCPTYINLHKPQNMNGILSDYEKLYNSICNVVEPECGLVNLGEIELPNDSDLTDLKKNVLTLPLLSPVCLPNVRFLRVRYVEGNKPGKVIRCLSSNLRRLKLRSHQSLCVQLLPYEEELEPCELLLKICQRIPGSQAYSAPAEMVWDTSKSTTVTSLKQAISECLAIPSERLMIAKHFSDKFQWMVIDENHNQKKMSKSRWTTKKVNLRNSPYFVREGDTIGVKDQSLDSNNLEDFNTVEDIEGQEILKIAAEGKRQRRQTRNSNGCNDWMASDQEISNERFQKSEIGITIHVDDFR